MRNVVATYVNLKHVLDDGTVIEQSFRLDGTEGIAPVSGETVPLVEAEFFTAPEAIH